MRERILVGMSGGVDSSVTACLLAKEHDVIGVTLQLHDACGGAADDARRVCQTLGIPHYISDQSSVFQQYVIDNFISEYRAARTPNPCVWCNYHIKFGAMLALADELGCTAVATGHYVTRGFDEATGEYYLAPAACAEKDQTYALYRLTQAQLRRARFPLAALAKPAVRAIAQELGLSVAEKKDSQEICFIPDHDYAAYIERATGEVSAPGDFIGPDGTVLGRHRGLIHYTVGQRRGLNIPYGERLYVARLDAAQNAVILGTEGAQNTREVFASDLSFLSDHAPPSRFDCEAKIRYNGRAAAATAELSGDTMRVLFREEQRAAAPGQSVVLYQNGRLLGGGIMKAR